ncbi:hypothetical protein [Geminocystis sp. NIES-3709]|uniref:O-linked N-acetylglucosamine transferase, SPINDLY family protein n=1 Tax=Geminocystis sp. NIES-3709 TaxID=1617448 RepID=UPI0005FCCF59|nr:hypothetical protein [Geminocystis sp. NIES-3709]BAQ64001.1 hypothetical protein GM3709_766 [Geminocystis sp. NIES-3709]
MKNWHPSVIPFLEQNNYQQVIQIYEEITENNPDELDNYWYLGLAYLLNRQETEAQTTWFIPFGNADEEETELWTEELVNILCFEAVQQEQNKSYDLAWDIRSVIKEINPENLDNLLYLLNLSIETNNFNILYIIDWGILQLLKAENPQSISPHILLRVLDKIVRLPTKESLELAEAALIYDFNNSDIKNQIKYIAHLLGIDNCSYILYAIDLFKLCIKFMPEDLSLYIGLYIIYLNIYKYEDAIRMAETIKQKKPDFEGRILSNNFLFYCYLSIGKWQKASEIQAEQVKDWTEIITENSVVKDPSIKTTFLAGLISSLYLQDNLIHNRHLFNGISSLFYRSNENTNLSEKRINHSEIKDKKHLKIGYIGYTFRGHSVGYLCRWLINHHDSNLFKIYIYAVQGPEDNITKKWFKEKSEVFFAGERNIDDLVKKIAEDQIDILVDLDSITNNITTLVLCQKPAPIQVTWLGLDASGLPTIDYYIADPYVLPDYAEKYYREKIWRLPNTYLAIDGFEIATPTLRREDLDVKNDDIIFMNLQNPAKLNPDILKSQLKIIKAVPNSYLFTKIRKDEEALKELVKEIAQSENISVERLRFIPSDASVETHRGNLYIADVILDTYPYNGSTTTLEALWAEIPVVTRVGEQFAARNSYTYMMNAGITEGIAWSEEEYIEWGIKFGTDEELRKEVSWKLRKSKKTSPLWNSKQFAREMEKAYQQMWEIYVRENT